MCRYCIRQEHITATSGRACSRINHTFRQLNKQLADTTQPLRGLSLQIFIKEGSLSTEELAHTAVRPQCSHTDTEQRGESYYLLNLCALQSNRIFG